MCVCLHTLWLAYKMQLYLPSVCLSTHIQRQAHGCMSWSSYPTTVPQPARRSCMNPLLPPAQFTWIRQLAAFCLLFFIHTTKYLVSAFPPASPTPCIGHFTNFAIHPAPCNFRQLQLHWSKLLDTEESSCKMLWNWIKTQSFTNNHCRADFIGLLVI